jgi:hypothetical protein
MRYYDLIMPSDSAWAILNEQGRMSSLQFVDLNSSETIFNRRYATYICRCEKSERRLRYLSQEMQRLKIETSPIYNSKSFLLSSTNSSPVASLLLRLT